MYGPGSHYREDVLGPDASFYPTMQYGAFKVAAMIAATANRHYRINFSGRYQFQFVDDAAKTFISAARSSHAGAPSETPAAECCAASSPPLVSRGSPVVSSGPPRRNGAGRPAG